MRLEAYRQWMDDRLESLSSTERTTVEALYLYFVRRAERVRRLLERAIGDQTGQGPARQRDRAIGDQRGQGTVEYVGLILLVSMLMVGMVAAMKGFNGTSGTEIAE